MGMPKTQADNVAQMLVSMVSAAYGTGATTADIAAGFHIAADRVDAWLVHKNWPKLRDTWPLPSDPA